MGITLEKTAQLNPKDKSDLKVEDIFKNNGWDTSQQSSQTTPSDSNPSGSTEWDTARARARTSSLESLNSKLDSYNLPPIADFSRAIDLMGQLMAENPEDFVPIEFATESGLAVKVEKTWLLPEGANNDSTKAQRGFNVSLSRDGIELKSFSSLNDVRINELPNGEFEIFELANGESILNGTAGDDILISRFAEKVLAGEGNDVVFALGKGEYYGDSGNDIILIKTEYHPLDIHSTNPSIHAGEGDDAVIGDTLFNANIHLGDGNNTLTAKDAANTTITIGSGNNSIDIDSMIGGSIAASSGNNNFSFGFLNAGTISAQSGNNNLSAKNVSNSGISFGDLSNNIYIGSMANSSIKVGHGDNKIYIGMIRDGEGASIISTGNGNNKINIDEIYRSASGGKHKINMGKGNNTINSSFAGDVDINGKYGLLDMNDNFLNEIIKSFMSTPTNISESLISRTHA